MTKNKFKVLTIFGTRPEIIRLSRILPAFDKHFDHKIFHTGQNYDYELNELFLWQTDKESDQIDLSKLKEELADVFSFAFLLAHKHNLDVKEIILDKIKINGQKYPVSKSKGIATKYDDL